MPPKINKKKRKIAEEDEDWIPDKHVNNDEDADSDLDNDVYQMEASEEAALLPGEYEAEDLEGNITKIKIAKPLTTEEEADQDAKLLEAARSDERFKQLTAARKIRFKGILDRGELAAGLKDQNIHDFSDEWAGLARLGSKYSAVIACKSGNWIRVGNEKLRQMAPADLKEIEGMGGTDSESLCDCVICVARRKNAVVVQPGKAGLSRTRQEEKKWNAYGPGRKL